MRDFRMMHIIGRWRTRRRLATSPTYGNELLIDALSSISRTIRSGQSLATAIQLSLVSFPCDLFAELHQKISRGKSPGQAGLELLDDESGRYGDSDLNVTLHVIALAHEVGGDIATQIDALVDTLLDRIRSRSERQAQAATATASMRLITWLPVVCGAWIVSDSAVVRQVVFATPLGWLCLTIGVALNLAGRFWTKRLVAT